MGWEKKDFRLEERELDWELGRNGNLGRKILQGKTWEWGSRKILGWEGEEVSGWKRILIGNLGGQWGGAGRDFPGKFQDSTSLEMSEAGWEQSGIMGREWDEL